MKKNVCKIFAMLVMIMMSVSGLNLESSKAAELSADECVSRMNDALEDVKSYELTTKTSVSMEVNGDDLSNVTTISMKCFTDPVKSKVTTKTVSTKNGKSKTSKAYSYTNTVDGKVFYYTSLNNKLFLKKELDNSLDGVETLLSNDSMKATIIDSDTKVNGKKAIKLSIAVNGNDLGNSMESFIDSATNIFTGNKSDDDAIKITCYIDKATYLPIKMSADVTDFVNNLCSSVTNTLKDKVDMNVAFKDLSVSMSYKNFNKVKNFKLPKGCK